MMVKFVRSEQYGVFRVPSNGIVTIWQPLDSDDMHDQVNEDKLREVFENIQSEYARPSNGS